MKIQKIHIVDFKCVEDLTLDFEQVHGFWEIEGVVGSGKTTLGEALLFGLFGTVRDKSNASLIRWGKKHSHVEIWCESKHKNLYIKRDLNQYGQSPLRVEVDGQPIVFTNKRDAQQQLEQEYYDVSKLMLEALCIISFRGFRSLSSMNTRETNEFLDQAFGFSTITRYANGCVECRRDDNSNLNNLDTDIVAIERQIKGYQEWQQRDEHITQSVVDSAQQQLREATENLRNVSVDLKNQKKAADDEYVELRSEQAVIKSKGATVKKNIDFIQRGICPTCGQPLDQSHLKEHQHEREELLRGYSSIQKRMDEALKRSSELGTQIQEAEKPLNDQISKLNIDIRHYQDQLRQQKQFSLEIEKLQDELSKKKDDKKKVEASIAEWDELQRILLHDVKDRILKSLIPTINEHISQYLVELHQPYIVRFDETFTCSIRVTNMDEQIPISSLSTGQLKTVDMVIILSILKTLLSNVAFNIIFLDELLSNMHDELRDMMCKMLKDNISSNQSIFIISHAPLNDTYLDGRIHVDYERGAAKYSVEGV